MPKCWNSGSLGRARQGDSARERRDRDRRPREQRERERPPDHPESLRRNQADRALRAKQQVASDQRELEIFRVVHGVPLWSLPVVSTRSSARPRATSRPCASKSSASQTRSRSRRSITRPVPRSAPGAAGRRYSTRARVYRGCALRQRRERGEARERIEHRRERAARERAEPVARLLGRVIGHLHLADLGVRAHDLAPEPVAERRRAVDVGAHRALRSAPGTRARPPRRRACAARSRAARTARRGPPW